MVTKMMLKTLTLAAVVGVIGLASGQAFADHGRTSFGFGFGINTGDGYIGGSYAQGGGRTFVGGGVYSAPAYVAPAPVVAAPVYVPPPVVVTPAPVYAPAPVVVPAPVYTPAPVVAPAPVYVPPPVVYRPAPVYYTPAPVVVTPAPVYAAPVYAPANSFYFGFRYRH